MLGSMERLATFWSMVKGKSRNSILSSKYLAKVLKVKIRGSVAKISLLESKADFFSYHYSRVKTKAGFFSSMTVMASYQT